MVFTPVLGLAEFHAGVVRVLSTIASLYGGPERERLTARAEKLL